MLFPEKKGLKCKRQKLEEGGHNSDLEKEVWEGEVIVDKKPARKKRSHGKQSMMRIAGPRGGSKNTPCNRCGASRRRGAPAKEGVRERKKAKKDGRQEARGSLEPLNNAEKAKAQGIRAKPPTGKRNSEKKERGKIAGASYSRKEISKKKQKLHIDVKKK